MMYARQSTRRLAPASSSRSQPAKTKTRCNPDVTSPWIGGNLSERCYSFSIRHPKMNPSVSLNLFQLGGLEKFINAPCDKPVREAAIDSLLMGS